MTWSRIGMTVSAGSPPGDALAPRQQQQQTVVCGYSSHGADQQQQWPPALQLRADQCTLVASTQTDFLLRQNHSGRFLLLREDSDQVDTVGEVTAGQDSQSGRLDCAHHTLGAMSGTATEFVATYDGISVGTLSTCVRRGEREGSGDTDDGKVRGVTLVLTCLDSGLSVQRVSCGLEHSVFLTCHGSVLTCGSSSRGQLGHGSLDAERVPRVVSALEGVRCTEVAAGGWHTAAITECGDLLMWGWNESGQLGLPCPALRPTHCPPASHTQPVQLGQQANQCQQCHQNQQQHQHQHQQHQQQQQQEQQQSQNLGGNETLVPHSQQHHHHHHHQQSDDQQQHQQDQCLHLNHQPQNCSPPQHQQQSDLCHLHHQHQHQPQQHPVAEPDRGRHPAGDVRGVASLHLWPQEVGVGGSGGGGGQEGEEVVVSQVACGSRHTAILTESGQALTTGWNGYGQLGLTHTGSMDRFTPVPFADRQVTVTQVWCGAWNTMFVAKELGEEGSS